MRTIYCPSCGKQIQFDDSRESGFCTFCGSKILNPFNGKIEDKKEIEDTIEIKYPPEETKFLPNADPMDIKEFKIREDLARKGHVPSIYLVATYYYGTETAVVEFSEKKAIEWLKIGAEKGDLDCQWLLGTIYLDGWIDVKNYKEAEFWLRIAAERGDADAQYKLGSIFDIGLGFKTDYKEAEKWYKLAAANGHEEAISALETLRNEQKYGY